MGGALWVIGRSPGGAWYNPRYSSEVCACAACSPARGRSPWPSPPPAGTVTGKVELVEKGGRKATDLSDVVVYVDGVQGRSRSRPRATMVMKGKAFIPQVVVVPVGGTVQFPNEDPIFHNAFSVSGETASTWRSTSARRRARRPSSIRGS